MRRAARRAVGLTAATAVMAAAALACDWRWFLMCVAWPAFMVSVTAAAWPRNERDDGGGTRPPPSDM